MKCVKTMEMRIYNKLVCTQLLRETMSSDQSARLFPSLSHLERLVNGRSMLVPDPPFSLRSTCSINSDKGARIICGVCLTTASFPVYFCDKKKFNHVFCCKCASMLPTLLSSHSHRLLYAHTQKS